MFDFVAAREFQIVIRRLRGLLDEAVQKDHSVQPVDIEEHASDSVSRQIGPDFVQSLAERPRDRHTHRPAEFHRHDVVADPFTLFFAERSQPVTHRLSARFCPVEDSLDAFLWNAGQDDLEALSFDDAPYTVHTKRGRGKKNVSLMLAGASGVQSL